jgi:hypothetical protein
MKRWLTATAVTALLALTACTPQEARNWIAWHQSDPAAAQEWLASPEGQASLVADAPAEEPAVQTGRGGCDGIYDELIRQGASDGVAQRLAYRIAPRESGCSPQFVHDRDDWSYSRFGLNGLTAGLRANWMSWCGADVRSDTQDLATDVRCALAAYERMGWRPWS